MKFYIAEGTTKEKLLKLHGQSRDVRRQRNALVKEFGAKGAVSKGIYLVGLVFDDAAPCSWRLSKKHSRDVANTYVPDLSREGKSLRKRLDALEEPIDGFSVAHAVGVPPMVFGRRFTTAAFTVLDGVVVVGLDDAHKPKKCRRIADTEYERLLENAKRKRKTKRKKSA